MTRGWTVSLALVGLVLLAGWGWRMLGDPLYFPVREVRVLALREGQPAPLRWTRPQPLQKTITELTRPGFFRLDLAAIREVAEHQPWVRQATARREWPDRLIITLREHEPIAWWVDTACAEKLSTCRLLTPSGEGIRPPPAQLPADLPRFQGNWPQRGEFLARYREWEPILRAHGIASRVWTRQGETYELTLADQTVIVLHSPVDLRKLSLLVAALAMPRQPDTPQRRADLRYRNGFVLQ